MEFIAHVFKIDKQRRECIIQKVLKHLRHRN